MKLCSLCQSPKLIFYGVTSCTGSGVPENAELQRNLMKCSDCGAITVCSNLSDSDLEKYYSNYAEIDNYFSDYKEWDDRSVYRTAEPPAKRVEYLRRLYQHAPSGTPHPDHMTFVGKKEL